MIFSVKNQELFHAIILTTGLLLMLVTNSFDWLPLSSLISFIILIYVNREVLLSFKPLGGYANWVTIFRLILLLLLCFYQHNFSFFWMGIIGLFILCLDGLDGYLARRFNQTSDFGGRLDGETDAYFVLQFSCLLYINEVFEWWVLWPGILRYFYVLTSNILWKTLKPEPVSYLRKTIAVVIMSALLTPFVFGTYYTFPIVILATIMVTGSFFISYRFQFLNN